VLGCGTCTVSAPRVNCCKFKAWLEGSTPSELLRFGAATLNQNDQHDDKENSGDNPDDCGAVHACSPFSEQDASFIPNRDLGKADAIGRFAPSELLGSGAAALNQNDQHDNKENSGNDPDNRGTVHCNSPFSMAE